MAQDSTQQPQTEGSWVAGLLVVIFLAGGFIFTYGFMSVVEARMDPCIPGPEGPPRCPGDLRIFLPIGLTLLSLSIAGFVARARRRRAAWDGAR